jgi:carboxyl-terminal processing protease
MLGSLAEMSRRPSRLPVIVVATLAGLALLVMGIYLGGHPADLPSSVRNVLVGDKQAALVDEALGIVKDDYYRKVDANALVNKGLAASVASLNDQFSHYFDPTTYRAFKQSTDPSFSGIGVTVRADRRGLLVTQVIHGTPAERAGLRIGDVIAGVGKVSLAGRPSSASIAMIKGKAGTAVTLTIVRRGHRRVERIERRQIAQPVVSDRLIHAGKVPLGYVDFVSFTSGSAGQVLLAVKRELRRGARGIVLDLRGNGGGLLDEAVGVASIFLPDGTIVSTAGRARARHVYTATGGAISTKIPVVVLVDRDTASSAEIVTGALQDRGRATVVGTRTYGKGVFQELRQLSNGGALDITVGEYFLPSGRNLGGGGVKEGRGIAPNVTAADNPHTPRDEALAVALKTLAAKLG